MTCDQRGARFSLSFFDPLTLLCAFRINGLVNGMSGTKILAPTLLILAWALETPAQKPPIVGYLAGDSTLAQKTWDKRPETGWGEYLQIQFDPAKVRIENHAENGRSTKSFVDEGRWQAIVSKLRKGDYVFIEFGHNDEKQDDPKRFAAAGTDYRQNLINFVNEVRHHRAFPVLLTPPSSAGDSTKAASFTIPTASIRMSFARSRRNTKSP
jgi:lysophospholipase L1-like esterase